ncbi:MAG: acyl carrier protein [Oscillospiraceae bacterium]|nr:acyl carrier protein [Oscillospiraceae bacterium]
MFKRVVSILCTVVEVNPELITLESNLVDDLGLNSLDVINLVVLFEQEFNVEIPDRQIMKFVTVGDVVAYLKERTVV